MMVPLVALAASVSHACGGLFCNQGLGVQQTAEGIVFAIDRDSGLVETHVTIDYTGPSEEFAWIVPVPGLPELFLSSDDLFVALENATQPSLQIAYNNRGRCQVSTGARGNEVEPLDLGYDPPTITVPEVDVLAAETVGPYDSVVLGAESEDLLVEWLQTNGYAVPDSMTDLLAPYVDSGQRFVALRLTKGAEVGSITPIGLRYPGDRASIPLRLTAVAAEPDMRVVTYILDEHRSVPVNALHVQINPAALDWLDEASNLDRVTALAIDEAGGNAFVTDATTETWRMSGQIWTSERYDIDAIAACHTTREVLQELSQQGIPLSGALRGLLTDFAPPPPQAPPIPYWASPELWGDTGDIDGVAFAAAFEARISEPARHAEALVQRHAVVTRLRTVLSPEEMTVDPEFMPNPDMGHVLRTFHGTLTTDCRDRFDPSTWERRLTTASGHDLFIPAWGQFEGAGVETSTFFESQAPHFADVIERTSPSGPPDVLVDNRPDVRARVCAQAPATSSIWAVLVALCLVRRRR